MSHLARIILISISLILPTYAKADDWDKYLQCTDRFYNLDKQEFKSISCNIEVPLTKNLIKQLHAQFDSKKDKIEIKENLSEFSLTYSQGSGLNFKYPSFVVKIISEEGVADPTKLRKGIEMVNAGFKQQIEGTVMQLQGLFEGFETPKKSKYKLKEIIREKATYTAKYEKDNSNVTETYSNNKRTVKQISRDGDEISSVENYKNIADNKLLLTDGHAVINNKMGNMELEMSVSYEKVKDVLFPSHTKGHFKQSVQTIKQEGQIDIYLTNCTLR